MLPGCHRMSLCLLFFCSRSTCAEAMPAKQQPLIKTRHWDFIVKQWTTKKREHLGQKTNSDVVQKKKHNSQHARTLNQLYILQKNKKYISRLISREEQGACTWSWWTGTDAVHWVQPNQELGVSSCSTVCLKLMLWKTSCATLFPQSFIISLWWWCATLAS